MNETEVTTLSSDGKKPFTGAYHMGLSQYLSKDEFNQIKAQLNTCVGSFWLYLFFFFGLICMVGFVVSIQFIFEGFDPFKIAIVCFCFFGIIGFFGFARYVQDQRVERKLEMVVEKLGDEFYDRGLFFNIDHNVLNATLNSSNKGRVSFSPNYLTVVIKCVSVVEGSNETVPPAMMLKSPMKMFGM